MLFRSKIKHEPTAENSTSIANPRIRSEMNFRLSNELNEIILSPVVGIQKVRKVLNRFSLDIPALYDLDYEGDEIILEMDQFGQVKDPYYMPQAHTNDSEEHGEKYYLYLIYALMDDGEYDFHAEITDGDGIEEILNSDIEDDGGEILNKDAI